MHLVIQSDVDAFFTSAFKSRLTCNKTVIPFYAVNGVQSFNQSNPAMLQYKC